MRVVFICVAIGVLTSSCVTAEERAAAINASDDAQCQSYGAQPGSQAYFQCRMIKDQQRQANMTLLAATMMNNQPQFQPICTHMPGQC